MDRHNIKERINKVDGLINGTKSKNMASDHHVQDFYNLINEYLDEVIENIPV